MLHINQIQNALQFWWEKQYSEIILSEGEEIPGGWLSRAFCFSYRTGQKEGKLFLRTCKSKEGGYTYSNDRFSTFAVSHEMYQRANGPVCSYGVFAMQQDGMLSKDMIGEDLEYFHVQDFLLGTSLIHEISDYSKKTSLDASDVTRMSEVGKLLAKLHNMPLSVNINNVNAVLRSQRDVLTHPQTTLDVLASYPMNHPILGIDTGRYEYLKRMHILLDREAQFTEETPCVPLHGDFWSSNILIDANNNPFLIDYSRIPYGDPAIDVGNFLGSLVFDGLVYNSSVYFDAAKIFLDSYMGHRSREDLRILERSVLALHWMGIIRMYPPVFGTTSPDMLQVFEKYIHTCYTERTLILNLPVCK